MRSELRFLLAIGLMLVVLVGTNILFPPVPTEAPVEGSDPAAEVGVPAPPEPGDAPPPEVAGEPEGVAPGMEEPGLEALPAVEERTVTVSTPLYRWQLGNRGARLTSVEILSHRSFRGQVVDTAAPPPVELLQPGTSALTHRVVAGRDTVDLSDAVFEVAPETGLTLREGDGPATLTFRYRSPGAGVGLEVEYTFRADGYAVGVSGSVVGVERPLLLTHLGSGIAFNEADSVAEARLMAYVGNHLNDGIRSEELAEVEAPSFQEGPFVWAAFRSKFFITVLMSAGSGPESYLGGLLVAPEPSPVRTSVTVAQAVRADGTFAHRLWLGPQEFARLAAYENDLEEVNPYGWRVFRPIVRPFVGIVTTVLTFLHNSLNWSYGWVLVLFGVIMRILLWPLNQKAMRAQIRNMAVQPLVKDIQTKHKDNPERLQKEMLKLYKEHGFNPMAGCLPLLLPWPVLIALFFVFQNTIEFRGVPFLWIPDLSAPDPFYALPVFLAVSMFLLQFISYRSLGQENQQMKMMMWIMPPFFGFIFMQFAAGLNLYYAVSNVATLPQQYWIAKERRKSRPLTPPAAEPAEGPGKARAGSARARKSRKKK